MFRQMLKQRASLLEKLLFTSTKPDENEHRCVVAIDKNKAVSYFHGEHSQLKLEDPVMLYNVLDPMVQYESTVESFSERHDIIVFKLTEGIFENFPSNAKTLCYRDKYFQVGLNSRREPIWNEGIVTEQKIGHYCTGASHGHTGDLGSGIFNSLGYLLGISTAKKCLSCSKGIPDGEIADHQDTRIVSAEAIFVVAKTNEGPDEDDEYKPIEECNMGEEDENDQYKPSEDE